ncbi:hypothetical protein [Clostridium uliginosum]|uniref:Uncharacterized protein n=1 Tax=Clostridium uliginosum TaxID=119641 RepID=A0A1I1NHN1_9CLOT|nr:hypothetical protein [Clostridium uliginosum]SFC97131.1 hypothetical protein SAMN05421842_11561 [Clostridium uliginosum]
MIYQDDQYIKISGYIKKEATVKFDFICHKCQKKTIIGYDMSRYGQVGEFVCNCGVKYNVTDNDVYKSPVKIWCDGNFINEIQTY